jgi:tripartite ATP-independent transporter DctP family solute receptor
MPCVGAPIGGYTHSAICNERDTEAMLARACFEERIRALPHRRVPATKLGAQPGFDPGRKLQPTGKQLLGGTTMFMKRIAQAATVAVALVALPALAAVQSERTFTFAHVVAPEFPYHTSAELMKELVEERSDGKWTMEIHHSGALGWERDALDGLMLGTIDVTWVHTAAMAIFVPSFNLFNMPFVFQSPEHIQQALDTLDFSRFYEEADEAGFKLLGIGSPAFRYPMNASRPITGAADFQGMRMRTMGVAAHVDTYEALGSSVATTAFAELYSALQMGTVDGNENALSALHAMRFHEVQEYLSLVPVVANIAVLVMSKDTWEALSPEEQALFEDIAAQTVEKNNTDYAVLDERALERMKEAGIKVNTADDLSSFIEATQPVREKYVAELDPWVRDLMDQIMELPAAQ